MSQPTGFDIADVGRLLRVRDGIDADDLVLAAVVRLDLLTLLADEPATLDELCARNGMARRPADVLCTLLRAMELLEPGEVLRPTTLARTCLVQGAPMDLRPYLASTGARPACLELVEVLRTGRPPARTSTEIWGERLDDASFAAYSNSATEALAQALAPGLADSLKDLPATSMLDISGSSGVYARELGERHGDLRVTAAGHMSDPLPEGHDLHLLSHTLHNWDEHHVRQVLRRCFDALAPGGWVVDHDAHLNADKTGPLPVARYSALLLGATEGRCWSVAELTEFLTDTGFVNIEERPAGPDRTVILAQKP